MWKIIASALRSTSRSRSRSRIPLTNTSTSSTRKLFHKPTATSQSRSQSQVRDIRISSLNILGLGTSSYFCYQRNSLVPPKNVYVNVRFMSNDPIWRDEEIWALALSVFDNNFTYDNMDLLLNPVLFFHLFARPCPPPETDIPFHHLISYFNCAVSHDAFHYQIVSFMTSQLDLSDLHNLWNMVQRIGAEETAIVTTNILNALLFGFSVRCDVDTSFQIFDKFKEFGCIPDFDSYFSMVSSGAKGWEDPWESRLCQKIIDDGILHTTVWSSTEGVFSLINMYCYLCKPKLGHAIYVHAKETAPQKAVHRLIRGLSEQDDTVYLAMDMLADLGISRTNAATTTVFSSVIRGLCRRGDVDAANTLLTEMIVKGPPPRGIAFNDVIKSLCTKGDDLEGALEMLKLMESRGLKPDVGTYHVMIKAYQKRGLTEQARTLLSMAKNKHPKLSPLNFKPWII